MNCDLCGSYHCDGLCQVRGERAESIPWLDTSPVIVCNECKIALIGDAKVVGNKAFHAKCLERQIQHVAGYPFECPVCHGNPRKRIPAHEDLVAKDNYYGSGGGGPGSGGARDFTVPERWETCEQCHGRGYVAKEPKQVPTGMKWVTE